MGFTYYELKAMRRACEIRLIDIREYNLDEEIYLTNAIKKIDKQLNVANI